MKNALCDFLQKVPTEACMTMDGWTDRYRHTHYFTYTYHCLMDWQFKSLVLSTKAFKGRQFGEIIQKEFESILNEFKINDKNIILVTDSATNMISAANLMEMKRLPCLAHRIQRLIMHDMLKHSSMVPLHNVINKMKRIQSVLLYQHDTLKQINTELFQNQLAKVLSEVNDLGKLVLYSLIFNYSYWISIQ